MGAESDVAKRRKEGMIQDVSGGEAARRKTPKKKKTVGINIKLVTVGKKKKKFTFPALPEKITYKNTSKYQSFDVISKGTVKVPKGTDAAEISWEGEFFGKQKKMKQL